MLVTDSQLKNFVRRQLAPFLTLDAPLLLAEPATAISECMRETAVPYFVVLGMFAKRCFTVLVDEAGHNMFQIPVVAEKTYFQGLTVFQGEMTWEYGVFPRQVLLVHRFLRLAGRNLPADSTWVSLYALIQCTFDTQGEDICRQPRKWPEKARNLAQQGKIVCLATKDCLTFQPKRWFALHEKAVMERSYLPNLRWLYDADNYLLCSATAKIGYSNLRQQAFFLLVERRAEHEWLIFARTGYSLIDMTLSRTPPLICLPNETLLRGIPVFPAKPVIVLFRAIASDSGSIDLEPQSLCPQRQLPDTVLFLEHVLEGNLNLMQS
jgi:hypothetical protein